MIWVSNSDWSQNGFCGIGIRFLMLCFNQLFLFRSAVRDCLLR